MYIKREDALKELQLDHKDVIYIDKNECARRIKAIPSADRPQGEWIEQDDCWQCSNCGDEFVLEVDVKPIDAKMHYCPNCGARMKDVTEGLESRTDLIWYGDKTDLIGDETGRHTGWFGKGADDETD